MKARFPLVMGLPRCLDVFSYTFLGGNEAIADTQIVMIATENLIFFTFNNPIDYVTMYDAEVISDS